MKKRKHHRYSRCIAGGGWGFLGRFIAKHSVKQLAKTAAKKTSTKAVLPAAASTGFDLLGREIFGKGKRRKRPKRHNVKEAHIRGHRRKRRYVHDTAL